MQKNPKQIWFYREGRFYQRRYHFQYGHFTRDALLFIFWYMHKAKMLNNKDWEVVIHQNGYKYKKSFIDFVTSIFPNVRFSKAGKKIPKGVRIMKYAPHHFKRFFNEYRNRWKMRRDERFNHFVKYIIDKLPINFKWIGFIIKAFPDAKIIHMERNPMAVCWSNYKINFRDSGMEFTLSQKDIAEYYLLYHDLMKFWNEKFGNKIININLNLRHIFFLQQGPNLINCSFVMLRVIDFSPNKIFHL